MWTQTCGDLSNGSAGDGREMLKKPLLAPLVITPLQSAHSDVREILYPFKVGHCHTSSVTQNIGDDNGALTI